jgi:manganese/zinc/iron transport system substrate-binding protein
MVGIVGCQSQPSPSAPKNPKVVATTTMLKDMVLQIVGKQWEVVGLMGPGVDPHLYKATSSDLKALQEADLIVTNGLHLEGKMQEVFDKTRSGQPNKVLVATDSISKDRLLHDPDYPEVFDPHVWFDVVLWKICVERVSKALGNLNPASREQLEKNTAAYLRALDELQVWIEETIRPIPTRQRILITSHDAFSYFGRAYGFQVVGIQGISTLTQAGLADITKTIDFIKANQVKAVFVESSVSPKTIQRISQDSGAKIGGELYSDATGAPGSQTDGHDHSTYIGMVRHNVRTIVNALQ